MSPEESSARALSGSQASTVGGTSAEVPADHDLYLRARGGNGEDGGYGGNGKDGCRGSNGSSATQSSEATVRNIQTNHPNLSNQALWKHQI
jgi:hypothetical protein